MLLTSIDFETTGAVPGYPNEPWQIGLVAIEDGRIVEESRFTSWLRVDAKRPFNKFAPGRHSQIRDTLAEAPTLVELWPELTKRILGIPLIAHNAATERNILTKTFPLHPFGPWVDTLTLARETLPGLPSYALEDVLRALDLMDEMARLCPDTAPHDALYDAMGAALAYRAFSENSFLSE